MPRTCTICRHPRRVEIDEALVEGEGFRKIAERFSLSTSAVFRHRSDHLPPHLATAKREGLVQGAGGLLDQLRIREQRADHLGRLAEQSGDLRTALVALREWRGMAELRARIGGDGELRPTEVVLAMSDEWNRMRTVIFDALEPYPDARQAIAAALRQAEDH